MLPATFTPSLLRQLELLRLGSRRSFLGHRQGGHLSPKRGHGIEFADYRKYEPGDNPRHIDWNLYGRSDRMYVKTYQEEQNLSVLCVLDTSASMFTPAENLKWERAREIVLALSYIALMQQEDVALCVPGSVVQRGFHGARAIHTIASKLDVATRSDPVDLRPSLLRALSMMHYPGVCVFVSDFLFPVEQVRELFGAIRSKGLDLTAIQVLGSYDHDPLMGRSFAVMVDSETGEEMNISLDDETLARYSLRLEQHSATLSALAHTFGATLVRTKSDEDFFSFLSSALFRVGLLR